MTFQLRMTVDMRGIHTHVRFDYLDLDFEHVCKTCPSCLFFFTWTKHIFLRKPSPLSCLGATVRAMTMVARPTPCLVCVSVVQIESNRSTEYELGDL